MEEKDLFAVPDARKEFEEHSHHGDYFFFVIEDDNNEIIGYLIAKREENKAVIKKLVINEFSKKEEYRNTAISNLYHYVEKIKGSQGKRIYFQVCFL